MAKYTTVVLEIRNKKLIGVNSLRQDLQRALKNNPAIYIYHGTGSKKIYIGQTRRFMDRHSQHYSGREEKFNTARFNRVMVVFSQLFHGSALDDVESQLITYLKADNPHGKVGYDGEIINKTSGNTIVEYEGRESVSSDVILPLWEKELYNGGWVRTPVLEQVRTQALVKYSPIKILTDEQATLIEEIIANPARNYLINGDAGTGKTVLLTHLVANILHERKDTVIGVVVQPNWEKTGRAIFDIYGMKDDTRLTISTSTKLIKEGKIFDVIIVDESHKLSRRGSKQMSAFNAVYTISGYENCQSHLEILQKMSKQVILMYDVLQTIRPANLSRTEFAELTSSYEKRFLKTQFRIQTPKGKNYNSEDYINGIKWLLYKDTGLLESDKNFNRNFNRDVFKDNNPDAYFGFFDDQPLAKMVSWLEEDQNLNHEHVNRVLAGLFEPWKQSDGSDPEIKHFQEGNLCRRWNSTQTDWVNSQDDDAKEQIGSVFAVQGIDLNKVGVLIGKDLKVTADGKLEADPDNFFNVNGKFSKKEMKANRFEFTLFVLNIYYVLLTRGIDGIRVGFWGNDALREYMLETLDIR